jgi:hypothetical protein
MALINNIVVQVLRSLHFAFIRWDGDAPTLLSLPAGRGLTFAKRKGRDAKGKDATSSHIG